MEALAHLVVILGGGVAVEHAPVFDGLSLDPFSLQQDGSPQRLSVERHQHL